MKSRKRFRSLLFQVSPARVVLACSCLGVMLLLLSSLGWAQRNTDKASDFMINLKTHTFDPLTEQPLLEDDLRLQTPPAGPAYYLIQFDHSLTRRERELIRRQYGLKLQLYVSKFAFLEQVTPEQIARLKQVAFVRAAILYQPAYKIDPQIGQVKFRTSARQSITGLMLRVLIFPDGESSSVVALLEELGISRYLVRDDRKFGGPVRVRCLLPSQDVLVRIARLNDVQWIEEVDEIILDNSLTAATNQSGTNAATPIWNQNLNGEGQIIGMIDDIPDINHCFFQDPTDNTPRLDHRKIVDVRNASGSAPGNHGHFVAGCAAGDDFNNPGTHVSRGSAWASRLVCGNLQDIIAGATFLSELVAAAQKGATIHTNSWHSNTQGAGNPASYNQFSADADIFTWNNEDHLVVGSAGNQGEEQGPPGTAKNPICVGAASADPNEMNFGDGNPGPTADGRRKPDLHGVGCGIVSSRPVGSACGTALRGCATSWATPHVAAAAALIRQYYTEGWYPTGTRQLHNAFTPSGALLKSTLVNSTIDMTGIPGYPSLLEGWGLIRIDDGLFFPSDSRNLHIWDYRNADGLYTGDSQIHQVNIVSNTQPLKVSLVWTEPPAVAGAANPSINDLDLVVTSPDGTQVFFGNRFLPGLFGGGASAVGGGSDATNNLEMVMVNAPAVGVWRIAVNATAVNVGNPAQGYALVATADMPEAPPVSGDQNMLVVRAKFSDIAFEPSLPNLINTINDVALYFNEVAYDQLTIIPTYRGPINLDNPRAFYFDPSRNPLIELSEEVVSKLMTTEPNIFDGADIADPDDDVHRLIIVTNDEDFTGDWSTTGPWPYDFPAGLTRRISVSIQGYENSVSRFTHGLGHQLGLQDLYAHENVVFAKPHVDEWDNMANPFTNSHFLAWSKERAAWITSHGSEMYYIPRPASGAVYAGLNPIPINVLTSTATNRKAVILGLTQGAATFDDEDVFYVVEARDNSSGTLDTVLPDSGVLIYYVNENIVQGEGPVQLRDNDPGTASLIDAAFQIGDTCQIPGTGIEIGVLAGSDGADYDINVLYDPPEVDNDVNIIKGDTIDGVFKAWHSPDIWVDSLRDGFDEEAGLTPSDRGDQPVTGETNRLYARIHNPGPGDAFEFDVFFRISEPYHTVGGAADFDTFLGQRHVENLSAGDDWIGFVEWTPVDDGDPHSCASITLPHINNDINEYNNEAQQNLREVESVTDSPYQPVTYRFDFTNPYDEPALIYFRVEGAPAEWDIALNPKKTLLNVGQHILGELTVWPPEEADPCQEFQLDITTWTPRGDTLIQVGGGTVQTNLRTRTRMTFDTGVLDCNRKIIDELMRKINPSKKYPARGYYGMEMFDEKGPCAIITSQGCTNPVRPYEEIVVKYIDPAGNPVYHTVVTDAGGCFEDFYVVVEGGPWQVTAEYTGSDCGGAVFVGPQEVDVRLPRDGDQDNDRVADKKERQGDADGDGIPNWRDADSDNDGRADGDDRTPYGESESIVESGRQESESTNTKENRRKRRGMWGSFHFGRNQSNSEPYLYSSVHELATDDENGFSVAADYTLYLTNGIAVVPSFGWHEFNQRQDERSSVLNALLNLKLESSFGPFRPFVSGGYGMYWWSRNRYEYGFNYGAGLNIALTTGFSFQVDVNAHTLLEEQEKRRGSPSLEFQVVQAGIVFKY